MCERVNPIEEIVKFLKEAETNYKATVEGDQPRVCPFGIAQKYWVQAPLVLHSTAVSEGLAHVIQGLYVNWREVIFSQF